MLHYKDNCTYLVSIQNFRIQKVQISPATAPIQFVNANKNPHIIQATNSLPRLNTVCLTLSSNGKFF